MSEELSIIKPEAIVKQIQDIIPRMEKGRTNTLQVTKAIQSIDTDEELENATAVCSATKNTGEAMLNLRMPITKEVDGIKEFLMQFEKDVKAEEERLRSLIGKYNQVKLDKKREEEQKAKVQKDKENHKVDIASRFKKKLADMLIDRVRQVQEGSKKHFEVSLEEFDDRATQFKKFKPILKKDQYDACFITDYNKSLVSEDEYKQVVSDLQVEESYDKWNALVIDQITPKMNEWIGKIPELKQQLIDLKNATDEESRKKIADEQKAKADQEERERQEELAKQQRESDENIQREAAVDKLQNDFREQAVTQGLDDTGPTKLILKFKDDKPVKALSEIMYHCFMSPKFASIIKLDKDKNPKLDEHGFPVFVDWVDSLVCFFLKNCDVNIQNIEVKEVSKVIVRAKK